MKTNAPTEEKIPPLWKHASVIQSLLFVLGGTLPIVYFLITRWSHLREDNHQEQV